MQERISAEDDGIKSKFIRLASLATKDIFKLAHELGSDVPDYYTDEDCKTMLSDDKIEALFKDDYIENVFLG